MALPLPSLSLEGGLEQATHDDIHFRPFAIEPADRVSPGRGHITAGFERDHSRADTRRRSAAPLELTLGLPAGWAMLLGAEAAARERDALGLHSRSGKREARIKWASPSLGAMHSAFIAGSARASGGRQTANSLGALLGIDHHLADFSAGLVWRRLHGEREANELDAGINAFRKLGSDWGVGAELRVVSARSNGMRENAPHWLLGFSRRMAPGVAVDFGVGAVQGGNPARFVTGGIFINF